MNPKVARTFSVLGKTPLIIVLVVGVAAGYMFRGAVERPSGLPESGGGDIAVAVEEIWTCSMHPEVKLPKPGKCPKCGMDLVLAKSAPSAPTTEAAKPKKYACSMFCVPPLPKPGKCPICGMDMVEVDMSDAGEDSGVGPTLTLSQYAQTLAGIQTAAVERHFVSADIRMVGKVDYDETRLKYITAWVPGRLDRLYVDYTGVPVAKDDHLVYLYSPELAAAQTELLEALRRVRETDENDRSLVAQRAREWLDDIRDKFRLWGLNDTQIAEVEARGTPSDYMTIYAPMGGIVIHKNAVEGMYVQTGSRIYTIADLSRVWVKLDAYESDLAWLRYGQSLEFVTEAYPGETFTGKIAFIDPVLDAKTRTVKLRVNVENADGRLKPEMFVRAIVRAKVADGGRVVDAELAGKWISPMHPEVIKDGPGSCDVCGMPLVRAESLGFVSVETGDAVPPLVIPISAPLITGKRALVYVEDPEQVGTYFAREVILGPRAGDHYIVREGLTEGERVVVNGNFKIDSAMQIMAKASMMNPEGGGAPPGHDHDGPSGESPTETVPAPRAELTQDALAKLEAPEAFRAQFVEVVRAYLAVQKHLSDDEFAKVAKAAKGVESALGKVDMALVKGDTHDLWMREVGGLFNSARHMAAAKDIEAARVQFALLSESMIVLAKRLGTSKFQVHRFHCPMAFDDRGGDWLQLADQTENPYFGATMYRCGMKRESYGAASQPVEEGGNHDH